MSELTSLDQQISGLDYAKVAEVGARLMEMRNGEPAHAVEEILFAGLYCRRFTAFGGTLIVGKKHLTPGMFMLSKGMATVWQRDGEAAVHLLAPHHIKSEAGVSRVIYAHTDIELWDIYHADSEDLEELRKKHAE